MSVEKIKQYRIIKDLIDQNYVSYRLQSFYNEFLKGFILKYEHLYRSYAEFPLVYEKKRGTLKKAELVEIFTPFFVHEELFKAMLEELPHPIPKLLTKAIWGESFEHEWIENTYNVQVTKSGGGYYNAYQELHHIYQIFQVHSSYRDTWSWRRVEEKSDYIHTLSINKELRKFLKAYVDAPKGYDLEAVEKIPKSLMTFQAEEFIFQEFDIFVSYIEQDQLKMSKSGKLLEGSLYKAKNFCNLQEFFPEEKKNKTTATLRTKMLAFALTNEDSSYRNQSDNLLDFIKGNIIQALQMFEYPMSDILPHLTGWQHYFYGVDNNVTKDFIKVLTKIPTDAWISVENLIKHCQLQELLTPIVTKNFSYLKRNKKYTGKNEYKTDVNSGTYPEVVEEPLIRNLLAFFASWGLFEIAYKEKFKNDFASRHKIEFGYLTPADSFTYFRFTNLGKYALGLEKSYEAPKVEKENIRLDDQHLFVYYTGNNKAIQNMINSVAVSIDKHLYKVSFETVLGDCNSIHEVKIQIDMIQKLLADNPPQNWLDFFEALQSKTYTLDNLNEEYQIFQLPENRELAQLIARDEYLRKHVIKAEYYNILIRKKDVNKVKKHLKKSGFLIDFS